MTRRLLPCDWTHEDQEVAIARLFRTGYFGQVLRTFGLVGDSRDADLMWQAQEIVRFGDAAIQLYGIDCRGWKDVAATIDLREVPY